MKKRFSEEQIIGFLREADADLPIKELCRKHGFCEASYCLSRSKFGGMSVPDAKRLKDLRTKNTRLKKLLAEQMLGNEVIKGVLGGHRSRTSHFRLGRDARAGSPGDHPRLAHKDSRRRRQGVFAARRWSAGRTSAARSCA